MGLDMYLEGRRYFSKHDYNMGDYSQPPTIAEGYAEVLEAADLVGMDDPDGHAGLEVRFPVGYWRKVNAVHGWFVRELANGVDECQPIWVSREQLGKLKVLCQLVLSVPVRAEEFLPPRAGFFFGGYELDEWYFDGLIRTIDIIDRALALPDEIDFIYQRSEEHTSELQSH